MANTIWYLRKRDIDMEVIDFGRFPAKNRKNRLFLVIYLCKRFLKYRRGTFNFTNHNLFFYLLVPYFMNRAKGNKYGCGCHLTQYSSRNNLFMKWLEFLCEYIFLQGASIIIIPSEAAVQQFRIFHIERKKKIVINPAPNIVCHGKVVFRKHVRNLVFVGHVARRKGLDVLMKAIGGLKDLNLHLDVVGYFDKESAYFKEIERIIAKYNLEKNVSFHGSVKPARLATLYRKADLFIFPSRHETYGMVLVEAMSFGLPIIASAIATTMEIVRNNINGILYETENSEALAQAIYRLATIPNFRRAIMQNNMAATRNPRTWQDVGEENFKALSQFLQE